MDAYLSVEGTAVDLDMNGKKIVGVDKAEGLY
jgi:hypothetical protein